MDGGCTSSLFDLPSGVGGHLPERDVYIIVIVALLACPQSEEFEELIALGGVLKRVGEVW